MAVTYPRTAPRPASLSPRVLRNRLVPSFEESRLWGWIGPIAITMLAAYLRFNRLSIPSAKVFDEVYYTHDSLNLLHHGVELNNDNTGAGFIVHPPLGKWMIAVGEWLFGDNSYGWRFSSAVVGTLAVLIIARTTRRMTRSTLIGCIAGLLVSLDGLEYVQSRTSMLDIFLMFWVVVAFACLILDRDQVRTRLVRRSTEEYGAYGPRIGVRWWLVACGFAIGCATACKWDGLYYIPAFGLLAGFWTMGAKRAIGVQKPFFSTLVRDVAPILGLLIVLPAAVYLATWTGWFLNGPKYAWDRNWAVTAGKHTQWGFIPAGLRGLWHYHWQMWNFHVHLDSYHQYRDNGWGWLFVNRPTLYYANYPKLGQIGCTASGGCARMIYNMGTPPIWWSSIFVMCFMVYLAFRRDWRGPALVLPFAFGYIPWLFVFKRTMFYFYALPLLPFICMALAVAMGHAIGPRDANPNRRMAGAIASGVFLMLVIVAFFYWEPVMTARTIPFTGWQHRMWFNSWGESAGS